MTGSKHNHDNVITPRAMVDWLSELNPKTRMKDPVYQYLDERYYYASVMQRTFTVDNQKYWCKSWLKMFIQLNRMGPWTVEQHIVDIERIIDRMLPQVTECEKETDMIPVAEFKTPKAPGTAPGAYVIRRRDDPHHPYVVHWRNDESGGYCWGGYHEDLDDAVADYSQRIMDWTAAHAKQHGY